MASLWNPAGDILGGIGGYIDMLDSHPFFHPTSAWIQWGQAGVKPMGEKVKSQSSQQLFHYMTGLANVDVVFSFDEILYLGIVQ